MNITIDEKPPRTPVIPYPKLMVNTLSGSIMLMSNQNAGTIVRPGPRSTYEVGDSGCWANDVLDMVDYTGTVILSN